MKKWIIAGVILALEVEWLSLGLLCVLAAMATGRLFAAAAEREV